MTRITEASAASILARLRNLARTEYSNLPANLMLLLYEQQGLLARLDASPHAGQFVLKGAPQPVRPPRQRRPTDRGHRPRRSGSAEHARGGGGGDPNALCDHGG